MQLWERQKMKQIKIKTPEEIKIMQEGGQKLKFVRTKLTEAVVEGVNAMEIEKLACTLIEESGARPSFKMVPGYKWATCININDGLVHGIPKQEMVFKNGDLVSIDVGLFYKGFHSDTSTTVLVGKDTAKSKFLQIGKTALKRAIEQAHEGNTVRDISQAIEDVITQAGYSPVKALTGHGVGRDLHEEPYVPCFVAGSRSNSVKLEAGMVLAIEVMYSKGEPDVVIDEDGWTIRTKDGRISALFEETVGIMASGPFILTG